MGDTLAEGVRQHPSQQFIEGLDEVSYSGRVFCALGHRAFQTPKNRELVGEPEYPLNGSLRARWLAFRNVSQDPFEGGNEQMILGREIPVDRILGETQLARDGGN